VFGARAGAAMREGDFGLRAGDSGLKADATGSFDKDSVLSVAPEYAPQLLWKYAGLFRDAAGLRLALKQLGAPEPGEDTRITVGRLVVRAALRREESRGGHYRLDFPARNDSQWKRRIMETV
jgi:L-aspartate oxidase